MADIGMVAGVGAVGLTVALVATVGMRIKAVKPKPSVLPQVTPMVPKLPEMKPPKRVAYVPAAGYARNPLKAHRNIPCPCGSNKKAKRCHGQHEYLSHEDVAKVKAYLRRLSMAGFIEARPSEIT